MADFIADMGGAVSFVLSGYEQQLISVVLYTVAMVAYSIIVWKFYKFIAEKDIFVSENVNKENLFEPYTLLHYFVFFPVVAFFTFFFFSSMMLFLARDLPFDQILAISATLVATVRVTAYYEKELAENIANLVPFCLLAVFLLEPGYYSFTVASERFLAVYTAADLIIRYVVFIVLVEWGLRIAHHIKS
jgi:hypothetical protein